MSAVKIKICGLSRDRDIDLVNSVRPDYCGFIVNVPRSPRSVSPKTLERLRARLSPQILPVGVFVNAPLAEVVALVRAGLISAVQLHGQEDDGYIAALREQIDVPILQAFWLRRAADCAQVNRSKADFPLVDNGAGGTGKAFDWRLLAGVTRRYFLAGGLTPENLPDALRQTHPYAVDVNSGVETNGVKDGEKIRAAVAAVRG